MLLAVGLLLLGAGPAVAAPTKITTLFGPFVQANSMDPWAISPESGGSYLIAGGDGNVVYRVLANGTIAVVAGNGVGTSSGDGGPATSASIYSARDVATTSDGGFLVTDRAGLRIRRVSPGGTITTVAGNGTFDPNSADGAAATATSLGGPDTVTPTSDGGFVFSEAGRLRKVAPGADGVADGDADDIVSTIAGSYPPGFSGDNGPATAAKITGGKAVQLADGSFLFADSGNNRIRKITPGIDGVVDGDSDDVITTVAGTGLQDSDGDGGPATAAGLNAPTYVFPTADGGYVIADQNNSLIRRVSAGGIISTIAGSKVDPYGFSGDGGLATDSQLWYPSGVAVTPEGIYVADRNNHRLRLIDRTSILSGPQAANNSTSAQVTFASSEPTQTFQCRFDSEPSFTSCTSAFQASSLSEGDHTLQVRALDANNAADPTPAQHVWTVDITAPAAFGLLAPSNGAQLTTDHPVFSWQATTDALTGVDHYELFVDGQKQKNVATSACSGGTCSTTSSATLSDGQHTWEAKAVDAAGNVTASGSRGFIVAVPPSARLSAAPALTFVNQTVTFSAAGSSDANGSLVRHEWDLDGNGSFERDTGSTSTVQRQYSDSFEGTVRLRVTDSGGLADVAETSLAITEPPPNGELGVSINDGAVATNDRDVTLRIVWPRLAVRALISNDGGFGPAGQTQLFFVSRTLPWRLATSGLERLPKIVYLRYRGGEAGRETYTDDIILDERAPSVVGATAKAAAPRASAASARRQKVKVRIKAKDANSGISVVEFSSRKRAGKKIRVVSRKKRGERRLTKTLKATRTGKRLYVRVYDAGGNASRWRRVKIKR